MSAEQERPDHLNPGTLVAFLDGALTPKERALAEVHLADCDACRGDMIAASRVTHSTAPARRWYVPAAAAAAAVLLVLVGRETAPPTVREPITREPVISATVAPVALSPRGSVDRLSPLVWSSVPFADLYHVTIFDDAGSAMYEMQTRDTSISVPTGIELRIGSHYFWKVEAQTGWNRWVPSELTEFSIRPKGP